METIIFCFASMFVVVLVVVTANIYAVVVELRLFKDIFLGLIFDGGN